MKVTGVQGSISFDDEWITITKKKLGQAPREFRLRAADITGTRFKPATILFHGYVQFVLPGSNPAVESVGLSTGGRPPHSDPHSLSIPHRSNDAMSALLWKIEQARGVNP